MRLTSSASVLSAGEFSSTMYCPLYGGQVHAFNRGYSGGLGQGEAILRHAWLQPQATMFDHQIWI